VFRPALLAALLVLAGCGAPAGPAATPTTTTTPTATQTPTPVDRPSDSAASQRAIGAEKARIRDALADRENLTDLSFGILRPAEATVVERNATGAFVETTVGYSVSFGDCSMDGAATQTRYFVSSERTRLVAVEQDVTEARDC